jgi:hypothetical protein
MIVMISFSCCFFHYVHTYIHTFIHTYIHTMSAHLKTQHKQSKSHYTRARILACLLCYTNTLPQFLHATFKVTITCTYNNNKYGLTNVHTLQYYTGDCSHTHTHKEDVLYFFCCNCTYTHKHTHTHTNTSH